MARKRIEDPESYDGLIDKSFSVMPLRRTPHFSLTAYAPGTPAAPKPGPLDEDGDREQIANAVIAERQAKREASKSWLDIACARSAGMAREELAYAQATASKMIATLFREHPEVMAPWAQHKPLFDQLSLKGWSPSALTDLHVKQIGRAHV